MSLLKLIKIVSIQVLLSLLTVDFVASLRDIRVEIPKAVRRGDKAVLKCFYDMEGEKLYSVKWYKRGREFYSYTPKDTPAMKVFQFQGIKVDRSASNESVLVLDAVNLATSGKYSCEVSADAPSFHTLMSGGEMEIFEVPGRDPVIGGIHSRYRMGDILRGNCTARHSKPAANLTWTVNGYDTNPAHVRHHKALKDSRELETSVSNIHFVITPQHFINGKLKLRCTAHIHDVYSKSTEKSIEEDRLKHNAAVNSINSFPDDYFDMEDENVVERSDTYLTHIKGDVSSLNANSAAASLGLFEKQAIFPHLTILTLLLYEVQQIRQLFWRLLCMLPAMLLLQLHQPCNTTEENSLRDLTPKGVTMKARAGRLQQTPTTAAVVEERRQQQRTIACHAMELQIEKHKASNNTKTVNGSDVGNKSMASNITKTTIKAQTNANINTASNCIKGHYLNGTSANNLFTTILAKNHTKKLGETFEIMDSNYTTPTSTLATLLKTTTTKAINSNILTMKTTRQLQQQQHLQQQQFLQAKLFTLSTSSVFMLLASLFMSLSIRLPAIATTTTKANCSHASVEQQIHNENNNYFRFSSSNNTYNNNNKGNS